MMIVPTQSTASLSAIPIIIGSKTQKTYAKTESFRDYQRAFQPIPLRSRDKAKIAVKLKILNTKNDKSRACNRVDGR